MRMRPLGRTGIQVSPYCLGAMKFGPHGNPDPGGCVRIGEVVAPGTDLGAIHVAHRPAALSQPGLRRRGPGLPEAVAAMRDELVELRDDRGRRLLDLADAPRPDPGTAAAPVRFLPAFDNAVLGYHDRSRIIDDEHRGLSVAGARVVLVDGRVAATWATAGHVTTTPLRRLTRAEHTE